MSDSMDSADRNSLKRWRSIYAESAVSSNWLAAHQWTYGPDVARATAQDVRNKLMIEPQHLVLEVGAGSGAFMEEVLHPGQSGMGFDLCEELVTGSHKFGTDRYRIKLGVAEAALLPLPSESFDRVLCYSVIHYFPDDYYVRRAIAELARVCKPGGVILFGDVAGIMERTRKAMLRMRTPAALADLILSAALPVRRLYRGLARGRPREGRQFRRSTLGKLLHGLDCKYEFLAQDIPGRPASQSRFDLRIHKPG